jgi:hypothetical protein
MKKILLLACILFSGISLFAQQLEGTFKNGQDSLTLSNGKASFRISGFAGLSTAQVGEGEYERIDDFLLVHTSDYSGDKSAFQPLDGSKKDTCVVKVVSLHNYPVQGILVESTNKSGKPIEGKVTGNDGRVLLTENEKTETIAVSGMGYNSISFDYTAEKDYLVILAENDVIENKTVVFRMHSIDEETLSLLLLTDDFNPGKKRDSELQKLEKKARKNNMLDKRMKKEYVPYIRKM